MESTRTNLGPVVLLCGAIIAGGLYWSMREPKVQYVKFGPGCASVAKEYLGGLNVQKGMDHNSFANMMTELAKCQGHPEEAVH